MPYCNHLTTYQTHELLQSTTKKNAYGGINRLRWSCMQAKMLAAANSKSGHCKAKIASILRIANLRNGPSWCFLLIALAAGSQREAVSTCWVVYTTTPRMGLGALQVVSTRIARRPKYAKKNQWSLRGHTTVGQSHRLTIIMPC